VWPGTALPTVYYDQRALVTAGPTRASMHAKCVVVDDSVAFVTSANFTEAAQARNVEAGALLRGAGFARALSAQFTALVRHGDFTLLARLDRSGGRAAS
jgi:phosphatidylserine/phosphatidylglycerophosphate/cardiolipin synthase-like enzyme